MNAARNALALALALALAVPPAAQDHGAHHRDPHAGLRKAQADDSGNTARAAAAMAHAAMDHGGVEAATSPPAATDHAHMHMDHDGSTPADPHPGMDHAAMDHSAIDHAGADTGASPPAAMDHAHMHMDHAAMGHAAPADEPRQPIPEPTDADRAAAFPALSQAHMAHGEATHWKVQFDRLEAWDADRGRGQAWEGSAWIGGDLRRLWLRSEGEREDGRTHAAELEALYGRSVSAWWDLVAGVKRDFAPGDARTWAALGVQGLAPYKFEVSVTAYLGESGQAAATLEAEYELLLSNRLILQPRVEARLSARDEPEYGNGRGLDRVEAGLRLRYEIDRRFAPYIGVEHERRFGDSAGHARERGDDVRDTRVVLGVRVWF